MLIQFSFFTAYFVVSLPAGWIVERIGYKRGIVVGLSTAGIGCLLFYPAAGMRVVSDVPRRRSSCWRPASRCCRWPPIRTWPSWASPQTASSRLTLTQAFNSLGTTIAPLFGSMLILSLP